MVGSGLAIRRHVLCGGLGKDVTVVCGMERAMGNRIGHVWRAFSVQPWPKGLEAVCFGAWGVCSDGV